MCAAMATINAQTKATAAPSNSYNAASTHPPLVAPES